MEVLQMHGALRRTLLGHGLSLKLHHIQVKHRGNKKQALAVEAKEESEIELSQTVCVVVNGDKSGIASFQRNQSSVSNELSQIWYIVSEALSYMSKTSPNSQPRSTCPDLYLS